MDDVNVSPNDASWQNDKLDDYLVHRTYNVHGVEDERRWRGAESTRKGKQLAKVAEKEKGDCRRLWVAGEERGFLACSLDMGQEINGTSNTDANSVNQAAQRPTSIMSCSTRGCTSLRRPVIDARSCSEVLSSR